MNVIFCILLLSETTSFSHTNTPTCCTFLYHSPECNVCTWVQNSALGMRGCSHVGTETYNPLPHRTRALQAAVLTGNWQQISNNSNSNNNHNKFSFLFRSPGTVTLIIAKTHLPVRTERFWPRYRRRYGGPWSQIQVEAQDSAERARDSSHTWSYTTHTLSYTTHTWTGTEHNTEGEGAHKLSMNCACPFVLCLYIL